MNIVVDEIVLYRRSASGKMYEWRISADEDTITWRWGEQGGQVQEKSEGVFEGLGGRSQSEQILSRVDSRINNKLAVGYVRDEHKALTTSVVNQMGFKRPMLATPIDKIKNLNLDKAGAQCKYDGHRMLVHFDGDEYTFYSRNGKPITTVYEVMEAVKSCGMWPNTTLDGELYHHGTKLQTISSWVKRRQPNTAKLVYKVYDIMTHNPHDYPFRNLILSKLFMDSPMELVPTDFDFDPENIPYMLDRSIAAGYEGLILRCDGFPYQDNKRSKGLVKVKKWMDDECEVIDIAESRDGWAILICRMPEFPRKEFRVSAPGNMAEKLETLRMAKHFIGAKVNVQYAMLTNEGKPFHPIATGWRDKENE